MIKHTDPVDLASELEMAHTAHSLRQTQLANRPEQVKNEDGTWPEPDCVDCGEEIPKARLELGKVRCIHCQEFLEKRNKIIR